MTDPTLMIFCEGFFKETAKETDNTGFFKTIIPLGFVIGDKILYTILILIPLEYPRAKMRG